MARWYSGLFLPYRIVKFFLEAFMSLGLVDNVTLLNAGDLANVPRTLRSLADSIEAEGDPIPHCVTIVWFQNGSIEIASAGMRSDSHDTHMLLTAAAQQLLQQTFG